MLTPYWTEKPMSQEPDKPQAIGYIRVSTEGQSQTGKSPPTQIGKIKAYADEKGFLLLHIYQDIASATGDKSARRPELAQAIREASAMKAPLIVTDIDRLTRSKIDLIEDAVKQGLSIHSVKLGGEVSSSALALETRKAEIAGRRNSKTTTDALAKMKASVVKLGSTVNKLAAAAASA